MSALSTNHLFHCDTFASIASMHPNPNTYPNTNPNPLTLAMKIVSIDFSCRGSAATTLHLVNLFLGYTGSACTIVSVPTCNPGAFLNGL